MKTVQTNEKEEILDRGKLKEVSYYPHETYKTRKADYEEKVRRAMFSEMIADDFFNECIKDYLEEPEHQGQKRKWLEEAITEYIRELDLGSISPVTGAYILSYVRRELEFEIWQVSDMKDCIDHHGDITVTVPIEEINEHLFQDLKKSLDDMSEEWLEQYCRR